MAQTPIENSYPGERLGLPRSGPRSVARVPRRLGALAIDWACATIIAVAFLGYQLIPSDADVQTQSGLVQFAPMAVFVIVQVLFIPTLGGSPGHRVLRMRVVALNGRWIGLWRPIVRSLLLVLVIPAVIWDADQRGLHDKIAGTAIIRS
ncbi:MAG: RDD family protein [Microbacterium sp.]|uniref:RDD family protein n=1 Tax=Microbacterium sp. TaxID=51671 RepID=UPI0039E5063E